MSRFDDDRRQRVLTDADIQAIAEAFAEKAPTPHVCHWNLSPDDVGLLKKFLKAWNRSVNIVGTLMLVALVTGLLALLSKGFWAALWEGAKTSAK